MQWKYSLKSHRPSDGSSHSSQYRLSYALIDYARYEFPFETNLICGQMIAPEKVIHVKKHTKHVKYITYDDLYTLYPYSSTILWCSLAKQNISLVTKLINFDIWPIPHKPEWRW